MPRPKWTSGLVFSASPLNPPAVEGYVDDSSPPVNRMYVVVVDPRGVCFQVQPMGYKVSESGISGDVNEWLDISDNRRVRNLCHEPKS